VFSMKHDHVDFKFDRRRSLNFDAAPHLLPRQRTAKGACYLADRSIGSHRKFCWRWVRFRIPWAEVREHDGESSGMFEQSRLRSGIAELDALPAEMSKYGLNEPRLHGTKRSLVCAKGVSRIKTEQGRASLADRLCHGSTATVFVFGERSARGRFEYVAMS